MDDDDELGYSYSMKSEGGAILTQNLYNNNTNLSSKYLMTSRIPGNYYPNEMKYDLIYYL